MSTRDKDSSSSSSCSSSVENLRPLAARVQGWQPITSAPTDRTIVAYLDTERTAVVEWRVARDGSGRWWESGVGGCTPVYWLPQPPAPERNVKGEWFTEADLQRAGQDWGDDSTTTPALAARVHALIAQWREQQTVTMSWINYPEREPVFIHSFDVPTAYGRCADALEAALAPQQQSDDVQVGIPLLEAVYHGTVQQSYPLNVIEQRIGYELENLTLRERPWLLLRDCLVLIRELNAALASEQKL